MQNLIFHFDVITVLAAMQLQSSHMSVHNPYGIKNVGPICAFLTSFA